MGIWNRIKIFYCLLPLAIPHITLCFGQVAQAQYPKITLQQANQLDTLSQYGDPVALKKVPLAMRPRTAIGASYAIKKAITYCDKRKERPFEIVKLLLSLGARQILVPDIQNPGYQRSPKRQAETMRGLQFAPVRAAIEHYVPGIFVVLKDTFLLNDTF